MYVCMYIHCTCTWERARNSKSHGPAWDYSLSFCRMWRGKLMENRYVGWWGNFENSSLEWSGINLSLAGGEGERGGGGSRSKSQSPVWTWTISRFVWLLVSDLCRSGAKCLPIYKDVLLLSPAIVIQRIGVLLPLMILLSSISGHVQWDCRPACKGDEHDTWIPTALVQSGTASSAPVHSASTVRVNGSEHIYNM